MASAYLFTCAGADGIVIANTSNQMVNDARGVPHCPSGGTWTLIEYAQPTQAFDVADLDPATLAAAFGAGFVVVATPLIMAWAVRMIIDMVRNW